MYVFNTAMKSFSLKGLIFTLALAGAAPNASASRVTNLGFCEGDSSNRQAFAVKLYRIDGKNFAQPYQYKSRHPGDESLEPVGGRVPFYDDRFDDAGTVVHHLMDLDSDFDHAEEADLHIVYTSNRERSGVRASIEFSDDNGDKVRISNGVCDFYSSYLTE